MKFTADREAILSSLQSVIGVIERRQTMPILANVLLSASSGKLSITATDLEVELVALGTTDVQQPGDITVPGRKFVDIIRALPDKASVAFTSDGDRATVRSGKSRFTLATLPSSDFPTVEDINAQQTIRIPQAELRRLIEKTQFSMAQQDVRYYLNGLLLEIDGKVVRAVATDGHRLAMAQVPLVIEVKAPAQIIIPRKAVIELQRLSSTEGEVEIAISNNHVRIQFGGIRFTSKLIDGRFPDYGRVVPANPTKVVTVSRDVLRSALNRTAILSNEKFRGIRVVLKTGTLVLQAHNPEQEEAEEELELNYTGEEMEIGFNVNYLLDALGAIESSDVELGFTDANSSCLVQAPGTTTSKYVVMPMRL
jgi:DNA polymerase III subunit beta